MPVLKRIGSRDHAVIRQLHTEGLTANAIAARMRRSPSTVCRHLRRLGLPFNPRDGKAAYRNWRLRTHEDGLNDLRHMLARCACADAGYPDAISREELATLQLLEDGPRSTRELAAARGRAYHPKHSAQARLLRRLRERGLVRWRWQGRRCLWELTVTRR